MPSRPAPSGPHPHQPPATDPGSDPTRTPSGSEPGTDFGALALPPATLDNLRRLGYARMTPIQAASLPLALAGHDLIAQARTGSGKTAAFALPLLAQLNSRWFAVQGLVLCPTRELADQVCTEVRRLARAQDNTKVLALCGGAPLQRQRASLAHGAHVVVGTPGRILDLLARGHLRLEHVRTLVLDEADRMLDMGFVDDIAQVLEHTPATRQTLLFSATYPPGIARLAQRFLRAPRQVQVDVAAGPGIAPGASSGAPTHIPTHSPTVPVAATTAAAAAAATSNSTSTSTSTAAAGAAPATAAAAASGTAVVATSAPAGIEQRFYEVTPDTRLATVLRLLLHFRPVSSVAFCNTRQQCRALLDLLRQQGIRALALYGDLEQRERDQVLAQFANRSLSVLVATDVAARGLDIQQLEAVINVDISPDPQVHVHRIGRTGRAGHAGLALSLASAREMAAVQRMAQATHTAIDWHPCDALTPASADALLPPMATLQLLGGRKDKIRAGDVLGALTGALGGAPLTREQVGRIQVGDFSTYIGVERALADSACRKLNTAGVKGRPAKVRIL